MDIKIKTCNKCGFIGEENLFRKDRNICKNCRKERRKQSKENQKDTEKICSKCSFIGDSELFTYGNVCKKCVKTQKQKLIEDEENKGNKKKCVKCGIFGEYDLFVKGENVCKKCQKLLNKQRIKDNENKIKTCIKCGFVGVSNISFQAGQNICKNCQKEYDREWKKDKYNNDSACRLMVICSTAIGKMLKQQGLSKNGKSSRSYLNFTEYDLYNYIEKQFSLPENLDNNGEIWMNWENQGKYNPKTWDDNDSSTWVWQLDHIIPKSLLTYLSMEDLNFKICWHLLNLRPLSGKQNILDNNRRGLNEINKLKEIIIKELEKEELEKHYQTDLSTTAATVL